MKNFVARAMQVSFLTEDQLERLHKVERGTGYLIPNWNLQNIFDLPMIRERYNLPVDNELLAQHNTRIEHELKSKGFLNVGSYLEDSLEWTHAFDKNVIRRSGEIVWEYAGPKKNRRGLLQQLDATLSCFL